MTETVGILGGTFDPVHWAHLRLAAAARERFQLTRVLFVPANVPPHKERPGLSTGEDRLQMLNLALAGDPGFEACGLELARPGKSYTADTLRELTREHPATIFRIIIGADNLAILHQWREPETVIGLGNPIIATRPGSALSLEGLKKLIHPSLAAFAETLAEGLFEFSLLDISSTQVRERLALGEDALAASDLPPAVYAYIKKRGLYTARA